MDYYAEGHAEVKYMDDHTKEEAVDDQDIDDDVWLN